MANVTARIKVKGKLFEVYVDCDRALAFKKGQGTLSNVLVSDSVFHDLKKGLVAKDKDLEDCFKTADINKIAERIIKEGEIQIPAELKSKAREEKIKQIVDFISTNCTDPKGRKHPPERVQEALKEAHVNINENRSTEEQISAIIQELQKVIPLKIESKKILVKVPSMYAGKVYGILHNYIEKEEWLSDGSLSCILNLPLAVQMDFYDKLNGITHGSAITQEVKEESK